MKDVFDSDYHIERILIAVNIASGTKIIPGETLIIFDEIQENPKAIASLKYFYENAPEYDILRAKSLRVYCDKYTPEMAVRTSMSDYREQDWMINVPLWMIAMI